MDKINVSTHAVERWRERTGSKQSYMKCENSIRKLITKGVEVKPIVSVMRLINHRYRDSKYYALSGYVAVVRDNSVITVLPPNKRMFNYRGSK